MDIREIDGLWCDDITFCQETCERMDCPRNKHHIRDRSVPHSFSVEIPQDCPKKRKVGEVMEWIETRECVPIDEAVPKVNTNLVEVVRCKDCKKKGNSYLCRFDRDLEEYGGHRTDEHDTWFCADGERETG